jgi:hypothetical protein
MSLPVFTGSQLINKFLIKLSGKCSTLLVLRLYWWQWLHTITLILYDVLQRSNYQNNFPPLQPLISVHLLVFAKYRHQRLNPMKITKPLGRYHPHKLIWQPSSWLLLMVIIISVPPALLLQRQHSFRLCGVINQDFVWWEGKNGSRNKRTKKKIYKGEEMCINPPPHARFVCILYRGNL